MTALERLGHRALNAKLNKLAKEAKRDREEVARKNAELKKEPKAAEENIARMEGNMRAKRTGQGTESKTTERKVVTVAKEPQRDWQRDPFEEEIDCV